MTDKNDEMIVKVKECFIWTNGMVMCLDEEGEKITNCQGFILDVAEKLKTCCDENTKWNLGKYGGLLLDADMAWYWKKKKEQGESSDNI